MVLIDTHAVVWWWADRARLSRKAEHAIAEADASFISTISCWEISLLSSRGRLALDRDVHEWVRDLIEEGIRPIALSPQAATTAGTLVREGLSGDPADGIIYATALEHGLPIVTKDRRIADFARARGDVKIIW